MRFLHRKTTLRNAIPVAVVTVLLIAFAAVLVVLTVFFGGKSLEGGAARDALGIILMSSLPLHAFALFVVRRAAGIPPRSHIMDERLQQFLLSTLASTIFAVIGVHEIWPFLPTGLGNVLLVGGILIYMGKPILFLRSYWAGFDGYQSYRKREEDHPEEGRDSVSAP